MVKFMDFFLLCMISLTVLNACAGKGTPYYGVPKAVLSPNGPRVAVIQFEDWNPPNEESPIDLLLVPGVLYAGHNTYNTKDSSSVNLAMELAKTGAFSAADYFDQWPSAQKLVNSYDFIVTGRLLGNGHNFRSYQYGFGPLVMFPMFLGLPTSGWMNFGDVEVVVSRVGTPYEPILKERVTYESSRAWSGMYYDNNPDNSENSTKWQEASEHIASALRASGKGHNEAL